MATTYPMVRLSILGETVTFRGEDVIEAETTQEIHPISIEVPASTARIRVWLDDTPVHENDYIDITAAGASNVNGTYSLYGHHDSRVAYYKYVTSISYYIVWLASQSTWYISSKDPYENSEADVIAYAPYFAPEDVSAPELVSMWAINRFAGGILPPPILAYYFDPGASLRDKFSPFSDGEYYQAMSTGLAVDVSEYVDMAEHPIGRFYLEEWNNPKEGELEIVCTDAVGALENKTYLGNFYETPTLVSEIIGDVLGGSEILHEIDDEVATKRLKGYVPGNISMREALQQVMFACGAYALSSGDGKLMIKQSLIPDSYYSGSDIDVVIADGEKTDSQELNVQPIVTGIDIISHDYSKGLNVTEEIFSAFLTPGDYMVVYQKPYWHVQAEGVGDSLTYLATTNNEVLVSPDSGTYPDVTIYTINGVFDFGTNYVYLHVPEPGGTATITGKPWLDATQVFSWVNPNSRSALPNIWKVDNATLVPSLQSGETGSEHETAADVLARVANYATLRYLQKITLFPRTDVDLGNIALVDSLYGKDIVGVVERMSSNLSGGYLIETEIVGVEHIP